MAERALLAPCGEGTSGAVLTVSRYERNFSNPFGHISIKLTGRDAVSFYPRTAGDLDAIIRVVKGTVRSDSDRTPIESILIEVTDDQRRRIESFLDKRTSDPGNYNVFSDSCVRFARDALGAGGILSPAVLSPFWLTSLLNLIYVIGPPVGSVP